MADTINSVNEKESVSDIFKRLDDVKRMQKKFMREVSPDPRFRSGNLLATVCEKEDAPYSAKSAAGKTVFFCMKEYSNEEIEQINQDSSDCDSYIDMMYFLVNKKDIEKRETE